MADKQIKQPGPDHRITIEPNPARVVVSVAGRVLADTQNALTLHEAQQIIATDWFLYYRDHVLK